MFSRKMRVVPVALLSCAHALSIGASSTQYSNTSQIASSSSSSYSTPSVCCFVVQPTATENYWPISSYITYVKEVNLTSVTLSVTPYRNGTVTNSITNIYTVNATSSFAVDGGENPISFYDNPVPQMIIQESTRLSPNVTAIVTGGTAVQSPAAFFVYSTLQIITAAPVTNADGIVQCGTSSSWVEPGQNPEIQPTWPNINSNAEAYFGGYGIAGDNQEPTDTLTTTATRAPSGSLITTTETQAINATYYTNSAGETILPHPVGTGVAAEIILTTPFVYMPERGRAGATATTTCFESDETELYGYVPQTLVDILGSNSHYVSQYPDLASCLPGGPSMIRRSQCYLGMFLPGTAVTYNTPVGGDILRTTVVTVTPSPEPPISATKITPQSEIGLPKPTQNNDIPLQGDPVNDSGAAGNGAASKGAEESANINSADEGDPVRTTPIVPAHHQTSAPPNPAHTTEQSVGQVINSIMGGGGQGGNRDSGSLVTTIISGTPVFVIPSPTTVPAAGLPPGIGSTTIINGTPFVVIQPTTIPIPTDQTFSTTVINGTPFLLIPGPTSIPLSDAPPGLTGTTTLINGTPFLVIPSSTSVPALPGQITVIDGTTYDIFSGPTTVPLNSELSLVGITTVISGTTMVILPGATTVPVLTASPTYVQVSGAGRMKSSLVGFGLGLVKGFMGRFR